MPDDPHLDPAVPVFFVSYSGVDALDSAPEFGDARAHVQRFFDDVSANVNELLPLSTGHVPGFLDSQMQGGEWWERKIVHAVGHCQVFVPLLSPRFLASDWCRFEWETFSQRTVRRRNGRVQHGGAGAQAAIVPVNWTAIDPTRLPPTIAKVQAFTPHGNDRIAYDPYKQEGVLGLLKMRMDQAYGVVVWRLARRIVDIVQEYEVVARVPRDTSGLGKSFREDSP